MRLLSYLDPSGDARAGVVIDGSVYDVARLGGGSANLREVLADVDALRAVVEARAPSGDDHPAWVAAIVDVRFAPPITDPEKIVAVGLNYADHVAESGRETFEHPSLFAKFRNSLAGHDATIAIPAVVEQADYEGELAVVVGRAGAQIAEADALGHVAGVMVANDLTARDLQYRTTQWTHGKAVDGFLPCGPFLVTLDEAGDLRDLSVTTRVNGETVQQASTGQMQRPVERLVASISEAMTLVPGDIILTGTPGGVGNRRTPPRFLTAGDRVEVEIEGLGTLRSSMS